MNVRALPLAAPVTPAVDGIRFIRDLEGVLALRDDWLRLEGLQEPGHACFFQSHAWIAHVARVRLAGERGFEVLVAIEVDAGRLRALWPLALVRRGGVVQAVMLDDTFGQFGGLLAEPGFDSAGFVGQVIARLKSVADGLRVAQVPRGTALQAALEAHGARLAMSQLSVVIDLTGFASFEAFNKVTSSKVRKILRNARNRLESAHHPEARSGTDPSQAGAALEQAFEERLAWMRRRGRFSDAFQNPLFRQVLSEAVPAGLPCIGFSFMAGDKVVSAHFGFHHQGRYYAYMSALNPDFEAFSAGRIHLGMVIEDCFGRGLRVLELMPPASRYKLEWNGTTRELDTLSLSLSLRGRLLFTILDRVLPAIRRASRQIPDVVRRPLVNLFNRN